MSGGETECPICNTNYPTWKINCHVELCLNKGEKCSTRREAELSKNRPSAKGPRCDPLNKTIELSRKISTGNESNQCDAFGERDFFEDQNTLCEADHSIVSSARSIINVLGKRKSLERSPPNDSGKKLKTASKVLKISASKAIPSESSTRESLVVNEIAPLKQTYGDGSKGNSTSLRTVSYTTNLQKANPERREISGKSTPLAEQMRPKEFGEYFGQDDIIGEQTTLRKILQSGKIPSIILWGPPGCGKTSLVNIIANICKGCSSKRFVKLSATTAGISDVKEAVKIAKNEAIMFKKETILFIDEIHRFNKLQQDFFLPHVENGTVTLIGATTENPSFQVNSALLSRCKVIVLKKHTVQSIMNILQSAVQRAGGLITANFQEGVNHTGLCFAKGALEALANLCDGDARAALNGLEMAIAYHDSNQDEAVITEQQIASVLQRNHVLYDRNGEEHYNIISAFHKSIRGSDGNAALYWLARMLEGGEDPLYVARRMIRIASEDIGIADSTALPKAVAAFQACHFIGLPECEVNLAHIAVYLARAPKSVEIYKAYKSAKDTVSNWKGPIPSVPLHLRNAPTKLMKDLGYSKNYKYNPDYEGPVTQDYLPDALKEVNFFPS